NQEGGGTYLNFATTTNPTGPASAWKIVKATKADYMTSLWCGPGGVWARGDESGSISATAHAATGGTSWNQVGLLPSPLDWQTCVAASLCIGVDDTAEPVASTHPAQNKSWVREKLPGHRPMGIVACAGAHFCVADGFDKREPEMLPSTPPPQAGRGKAPPADIGSATLTGLTCHSRSFCVGVSQGGLGLSGSGLGQRR